MEEKKQKKPRRSGLNLTPQSFMISASLSDGPKHGYAIMKDLKAATAGKVVLSAGTLYENLGELQNKGLVELQRTDIVAGKTRKTYGLTNQGLSEYEDQADIMKSLFSTKERRGDERL